MIPHCGAAKLAADTTHESFENPTYLIEAHGESSQPHPGPAASDLHPPSEAFIKLSEMNSKGSITQTGKVFRLRSSQGQAESVLATSNPDCI